jgi:hypothetical protein
MIVECNSIKIEIHALGTGVNDRVWRRDMAFECGEFTIRMMVTDPRSIIGLAPEGFRFHTGQRYKLVSCFGVERPLRKMDISI